MNPACCWFTVDVFWSVHFNFNKIWPQHLDDREFAFAAVSQPRDTPTYVVQPLPTALVSMLSVLLYPLLLYPLLLPHDPCLPPRCYAGLMWRACRRYLHATPAPQQLQQHWVQKIAPLLLGPLG
jgi:hypothetical protein